MQEIYIILEDGKISNVVSKADNIKIIVIDLDPRKNNQEPVIDFYTAQVQDDQLAKLTNKKANNENYLCIITYGSNDRLLNLQSEFLST